MSRKGYLRQPGDIHDDPTAFPSKCTQHARAHHATPREELYLLQYKFLSTVIGLRPTCPYCFGTKSSYSNTTTNRQAIFKHSSHFSTRCSFIRFTLGTETTVLWPVEQDVFFRVKPPSYVDAFFTRKRYSRSARAR